MKLSLAETEDQLDNKMKAVDISQRETLLQQWKRDVVDIAKGW